jgi:hypothetical protein
MARSVAAALADITLPDADGREVRLGSLWESKNPFQLGGSFVFGPGNVDRFVHVSETFGDNASPAALLGAVRGG